MKYFAFISALFLLVACAEEEKEVTTDIVENLTEIKFENELYDFGEITQGEKVKFTYKFTNVGESDLVISSAKGSCGCTVPDWPRKPIAPGESAEIRVVFNSEGKNGKQHKKVSVIANTQPSTTVVALTGNIIKPAVEEMDEASGTDENVEPGQPTMSIEESK
ncbi:DUF1573 domain-containing protein [Salibacteraceae bacterium]|nr:hypothetical protein [Crocinitomicaceae bacterium]MDB0058236.1 DUF1573 domain-containing protein [Salibacteraceae bacterium]|tara:strand:- start:54234 stop:54722 length:489 start_codon:yes stop_codon:yes gene_type:complete